MKASSSQRALLTNGSASSSARAQVASPLAATSSISSKKSRRQLLDKPPPQSNTATAVATPVHSGEQTSHAFNPSTDGTALPASNTALTPEMLFQLQQLQHQQQLHQQQGMVPTTATFGYPNTPIQSMQHMQMAYPSYMPPYAMHHQASSANIVSSRQADSGNMFHSLAPPEQSTEGTPDLMVRIEKKDQMITQLGSFLSQIKQESEGTAHAWKEKMQELAALKEQVTTLTQQLNESKENEEKTAMQLAQVTEDVELAVHGLKETEANHLEELKVMNDEMQRREEEHTHARSGFEETLRSVSEELVEAQGKLRVAEENITRLQAALEKAESGRDMVSADYEIRLQDLQRNADASQAHVETLESEKQELGQHLWNITQQLEKTKASEQQLETRLNTVNKEMEDSRCAWTERFQSMQKEKAEILTAQSELQAQLVTIDGQMQEERSQKEELNALMLTEMQRVSHDTEMIQQQHAAQLKDMQNERDQWKADATELQQKFEQLDTLYTQTRQELDDIQSKMVYVDQENQRLQQNGTEKTSTLEEMNEELRQTMDHLHELQQRHDQAQQKVEQLESGVQKCLQLTPECANDDSEITEVFPTVIFRVLEEASQQASIMEQTKLSMLRIKQDRDTDRDKARQREQELTQNCQNLQLELETTKADAQVLAKELQDLTQRLGGSESKFSAEIQQLTMELHEARSASALQVMQLQKTLDSQKTRVHNLENEKKELLQEAEGLNASMEAVYQAKNEKQVELDQVKALLRELQIEHSDLKETREDLESSHHRAMDELNAKTKEMQQQVQKLSLQNETLEREHAGCHDLITKSREDLEDLNKHFMTEHAQWEEKTREAQQQLEEKTVRLEEMMDMLTQLRSRNEFLEEARAKDDQNTRVEIDKQQQQILAISQDKKRIEIAFNNVKAQHDQTMQEIFTLKEEKRQLAQGNGDMDEEIARLRTEVTRLSSEVERLTRAKSAMQLEFNRVADEAQDVQRQYEVLRRDSRAQEKSYQDDAEKLQKEVEYLRGEAGESNAMMDEMQTKMTSIQNAANATINDLMAELQHAQETQTYEKSRAQKECESLKSQVNHLGDEARHKDAEIKELQGALRLERDAAMEKENELSMKISRLSMTLETKRQEVEKLSKDLEAKTFKVAEFERKFTPLTNAKEALQTKLNEVKHSLDMKVRESHELEERLHDDVTRAVKEKREVETMYMAMKEEYELIKSQSSGQQNQWNSETRSLKQNLERTKADLIRANAEVQSLSQRLESCQIGANETITDLSTRLHGADQQREMAVNALQREINLERERRREAEVQKMELQRLIRQRTNHSSQSAGNTAVNGMSIVNAGANSQREITGRSLPNMTPSGFPESDQLQDAPQPPPATAIDNKASGGKSAPPPEYQKFYTNEPMSNTELANLPMTLIKAQIGLELTGNGSLSPSQSVSKHARPSPAPSPQVNDNNNNDDVPPLALEKLPHNPERGDMNPAGACDTDGSSRLHCDQRGTPSTSASYLSCLSSRSNSDRCLADMLDSSHHRKHKSHPSPSQRGSGNGGGSSNNNPKKKAPASKGPRPAGNAATANAYAAFSSLTNSTLPSSPTKTKAKPKLLPRIQQ